MSQLFMKNIAANQNVKEREYWLKKLEDIVTTSGFPYDNIDLQSEDGKMVEFSFELKEPTSQKLIAMSKNSEYAMTVIILSAMFYLLRKYTGNDNGIINAPIFKQEHEGNFVNSVLLFRTEVDDSTTFKQLIMKVKQTMQEANDNSNYPVELLVRELYKEDYTDLSMISNISVVCENIQNDALVEDIKNSCVLTFCYKNNRLHFLVRYHTKYYLESTIRQIVSHFGTILDQALFHADVPLSNLKLLSEAEQRQIIHDFNNKSADLSNHPFVHEIIATYASETPDCIAVVCDTEQLTYRELDERSNQLAHFLRENGVGREALVGIFCERSIEMVIGIVGIWKAGGAYIPIDILYPQERMEAIINDSGLSIILTREESASLLQQTINTNHSSLNIIKMDQEMVEGYSKNAISNVNQIDDLAYVIYTSGSTGQPKGVLIEHIGMINHLDAMIKELQLDKNSRIAQNASHCFDISVWQFINALVVGGQTYIYKEELIHNPRKFIERTIQDGITILQVVPSYLVVILDVAHENILFKNLEYLLVTGEPVSAGLLSKCFHRFPNLKMVNAYGPAEASDDISLHIMEEMPKVKRIPIGKSIQNCRIYIVNESMELCPIGVKGEICVSGVGVGRGYINDKEKTSESFMEDPFVTDRKRLYKTGDVGRWMPCGTLEFHGRKDNQVKIRGFRIELGEIENAVMNFKDIQEAAAATSSNENGFPYLCLYFTAQTRVNTAQIREYLSQKLPSYMIPHKFIQLEHMPLNANGKINRKALSERLAEEHTEVVCESTQSNETIAMLAKLWSEILGVNQVGMNDHFFLLGGDSIKAIQLSVQLHNEGLNLEINDVFLHPKLGDMANYVERVARDIDQGVVTGKVELTPVQMNFFESDHKYVHHNNQVALLKSKHFDEMTVQRVFTAIIHHHDALRMVYTFIDGNVNQTIQEQPEHVFDFELVHLKSLGEEDIKNEISQHAEVVQRSIHLTQGPLVKLCLVKGRNEDYLLIIIHHLVVDGVSWRILLEDFDIGYSQFERGQEIKFQAKTDSYQAWANKLNKYAQSSELLDELLYWHKIEQLDWNKIRTDYDRDNEIITYRSARIVNMELDRNYTEQLVSKVNKAYDTEINDILLAALSMAFQDWASVSTLVINLEGHGRENIIDDIYINRTVGWFTSQYPAALIVSERQDYATVIMKIKEQLRNVPNKGIGYGILRYLTSSVNKNNLVFNKNPELNFNYLGHFSNESNDGTFEMVALKLGDPKSMMHLANTVSDDAEMTYLLNIEGSITEGQLGLTFGYSDCLYDRQSIEKLADLYKQRLVSIIDHCVMKSDNPEQNSTGLISSILNRIKQSGSAAR